MQGVHSYDKIAAAAARVLNVNDFGSDVPPRLIN